MFICVSLLVHTLKSKIIDVEVEGLVCDFYAQSIESFYETTRVSVVYVNLDRGNVHIKMMYLKKMKTYFRH